MTDDIRFSKLHNDIQCKVDRMCDINIKLQGIISQLENSSTDADRDELIHCREYLQHQVNKIGKDIGKK